MTLAVGGTVNSSTNSNTHLYETSYLEPGIYFLIGNNKNNNFRAIFKAVSCFTPASNTAQFSRIYKQSGNSVDSDQLASEKPADLDLHCFQNTIYPGLAW